MEKEAYLYKKLPGKKVKCLSCSHYCVVDDGEKGICRVKENKGGKLYSLNYGKVVSISIDPIEKKPLFHFLPGSKALSFASAGCNFQCENCQNWLISQSPRIYNKIIGEEVGIKEIVSLAKKENISSIAYTYTEPTIFLEYALDVMKEAKKNGLKNVWVSNGFFTKETLNLISPYLDAINIDLKSFNNNFYLKHIKGKLSPVLENLIAVKKKKIWLEVTTLIIPGLNDSANEIKKIASFIAKELGAETPWHISRFFGSASWKLKNIGDTPLNVLEKAYKIGKDAGLNYVYLGNVQRSEFESTYCPKCGYKAIERNGYQIKRRDNKGVCPKCGAKLNIIDK